MPGYLLDAGTTIMCPHGGKVTIPPGKTSVSLGGMPPFVLDDFAPPTPVISGCTFNVSGSPSPCLRIQWSLPATRVKVGSSPVLLSSSIGLCQNAASVPQGTAIVSGFQTKVQGQ